MKTEEKLIENRRVSASGVMHDAASPPVVIDVAQLFQGRSEVALRLGDAVYHLKITRFGKLILNK